MLEPFNRLIEDDHLMAYKYEGFWRAMDTLRDRQVLEDMVERGEMPWRAADRRAAARGRVMRALAACRDRAIACRSSVWARIRTTSRSAPAPRCLA